ncbi:hypothetical protein [Vibrio sp. 10N.247.311.51]|uniref:hypothetical protein n=1 Tax=Vibrio sp. 10N.247.311.51 TaxID=3229996 RepID=UPI00355457E8
MWRIKIHQHNGHIVSITKFRKSQRSKWAWLIGKTDEILRVGTENETDELPSLDWAETDEPTQGQVRILNEVETDWAETDEPYTY